ncbi:hypothetical protein O181_090624 [Austropuccinia psidii MF-1]|uniref:Uncharacterized protein n=1 Tax=Austropuccinia psidii MF-1 TaxID=1389203 RepID=A0A9Q3P737_9BASI|nr:hypothetical protein [Austropuccinia psidii MF-1]
MLRMLTSPHRPPDETLTLPPHLRPHHSLRFHTPPIPSLCSRGALPTCSRHHLSLRSLKCPPDMLPTLLTIITLAECTPDITYPYARSSALPTLLILTLV